MFVLVEILQLSEDLTDISYLFCIKWGRDNKYELWMYVFDLHDTQG